jgi:hypothetical protein
MISSLKVVSINLIDDVVISVPLASKSFRNIEFLVKNGEEVLLEVSLLLLPFIGFQVLIN